MTARLKQAVADLEVSRLLVKSHFDGLQQGSLVSTLRHLGASAPHRYESYGCMGESMQV